MVFDNWFNFNLFFTVFAFGTTLYEIVSLKKIYFQAENVYQLNQALSNTEKNPPDMSLIPSTLSQFSQLILSCIKLSPKSRPSISELIELIERL